MFGGGDGGWEAIKRILIHSGKSNSVFWKSINKQTNKQTHTHIRLHRKSRPGILCANTWLSQYVWWLLGLKTFCICYSYLISSFWFVYVACSRATSGAALAALCCMYQHWSPGVFTVQVKPKFTTESHYYYPFYTEIRLKICVCRILNQLGPAGACQGLQAPRCVSWRHTGVLGRLTSAFHRLHHISGLTLGPAEARRHYPWKKCWQRTGVGERPREGGAMPRSLPPSGSI